MIIKLSNKTIYQAEVKNPKAEVRTYYYDGLDRIRVFTISAKEMHPPIGNHSVDRYMGEAGQICEESDIVMNIDLFKKDAMFKTLYIDFGYSVYLMSDEGKTIERIN